MGVLSSSSPPLLSDPAYGRQHQNSSYRSALFIFGQVARHVQCCIACRRSASVRHDHWYSVEKRASALELTGLSRSVAKHMEKHGGEILTALMPPGFRFSDDDELDGR